MVGHSVGTAKGGKSGKAKSLFIRQNTGKNRKIFPFLCVLKSEYPACFIRGTWLFYINSLHVGTGKNRDWGEN